MHCALKGCIPLWGRCAIVINKRHPFTAGSLNPEHARGSWSEPFGLNVQMQATSGTLGTVKLLDTRV
jgi:hypothetical protein